MDIHIYRKVQSYDIIHATEVRAGTQNVGPCGSRSRSGNGLMLYRIV